jgi:uncharacterized membrane protein
VSLVLGIVLLLIGVALVLVARPGGSRLGQLSMSKSVLVAYGILCLMFIGFGVISIIKAWPTSYRHMEACAVFWACL